MSRLPRYHYGQIKTYRANRQHVFVPVEKKSKLVPWCLRSRSRAALATPSQARVSRLRNRPCHPSPRPATGARSAPRASGKPRTDPAPPTLPTRHKHSPAAVPHTHPLVRTRASQKQTLHTHSFPCRYAGPTRKANSRLLHDIRGISFPQDGYHPFLPWTLARAFFHFPDFRHSPS